MPSFIQPPMMPPPAKRQDVNEDVKRLEELAVGANGGSPAQPELPPTAEQQHQSTATPAKPKIILLEDLMKEEEEDELAATVSFKEMQKIIGIER